MPRKRKPVAAALDLQHRQRAKLIDEYAALDREVADFKSKLFRHSKLRGLILSWYPGAAAEEEILACGTKCDIVISARDLIRSVTGEGKQKLYRLWGIQGFIAKAAIYLKTLPDPEDRAGLYTAQANTGPRHLRVVNKATSENAA